MWKTRVKNAVLITAITLVLTTVVCEIGLRIVGFEAPPLYRSDEHVGWTLRPNVSFRYEDEGESTVTTSSAGLRDVEHAMEKAPGTYRIVVLGDSFAEAVQVERERTFWAKLDDALSSCASRRGRKIEAINFGVSSYGTANEVLVLEGRAMAYSPDLVLTTFFTGNDLQDNHPALDHLRVPIRPYFHASGDGLVLEPGRSPGMTRELWTSAQGISRAAQLVERIRKRRAAAAANVKGQEEANIPRQIFAADTSTEWSETWLVTERLLRRMNDDARAHQARFLLVAIPPGIAINPDDAVRERFAAQVSSTNLLYVESRVEAIANGAGIDFLGLGAPLLGEARRTKQCLYGFRNAAPCAGHWNEHGHEAASAAIAEKICQMWSSEREASQP